MRLKRDRTASGQVVPVGGVADTRAIVPGPECRLQHCLSFRSQFVVI